MRRRCDGNGLLAISYWRWAIRMTIHGTRFTFPPFPSFSTFPTQGIRGQLRPPLDGSRPAVLRRDERVYPSGCARGALLLLGAGLGGGAAQIAMTRVFSLHRAAPITAHSGLGIVLTHLRGVAPGDRGQPIARDGTRRRPIPSPRGGVTGCIFRHGRARSPDSWTAHGWLGL